MKPVRIFLACDSPLFLAGVHSLLKGDVAIAVTGAYEIGRPPPAQIDADVLLMLVTLPTHRTVKSAMELLRRSSGVPVLFLIRTAADVWVLSLHARSAALVYSQASADDLIRAILRLSGRSIEVSDSAFIVPHTRVHPDGLSFREKQVLVMVAEGMTSKEIGARLAISPKTVDSYRARIAEKLHLRTRAQYERYARGIGLLVDEALENAS